MDRIKILGSHPAESDSSLIGDDNQSAPGGGEATQGVYCPWFPVEVLW